MTDNSSIHNSSVQQPLLSSVISREGDESVALIPVQVKVYKRRWWILFLFAALGFMQCAIWNTWGPIADSVKSAYPSWSDAQIGLLSMWGTITMLVGLIPFTYMLQIKGLRVSILVTSGLLAAGASVRLFASDETAFTVMAHIGALLNGFAGIIIGSAPSLLSSTWFPPNERTTATGIGCTFNQLGNAGGFFLGPWLVEQPKNHSNASFPEIDMDEDHIRRNIRDYMWITAALCVPLFLLCLAYFPDRPKRPPSLTSAIQHSSNSLKEDLRLIKNNGNFWLMMVPYGLTLGTNVAWSSILDINLAPVGITQDEASWVGIYMTFGGVALAIIISRFSDLLFGYLKITIIMLMLVSSATYIWFLLLMNGCIPFDKTQVFVSSVMAASFSYATSPLFFELGVEIAFPVPEGIAGCFLTIFWNLTAAIFLAVLQLGMKNLVWMDYVLAIQGIVSLVVMALVKEEYKRSALDKAENATVTVSQEDEGPQPSGPLLGDMYRSTTSYGSVNIT